MRACAFFVLCGLAIALSAPAADDPAALLKPAKLGAGEARVRVPVEGGFPRSTWIKAQVPHGNKPGETIGVSVALDSLPGRSVVAAKTLAEWGYEVPKGEEFVTIKELLIPAAQLGAAPKKGGRDVLVRVPNVRLYPTEPPADAKNRIFGSDLSLCASDLYQGKLAEKSAQPRLAFADRFLELTVPEKGLTRLETSDLALPDATADATPGLVTVSAALPLRKVLADEATRRYAVLPAFEFASVNGIESYERNKFTIPVTVGVAAINNWECGVMVTMGVVRGCGIKETAAGEQVGVGAAAKSAMAPGVIGELRLALTTDKGRKDLWLKDVPVIIDKNTSNDAVWLGPKFVEKHFKDGVYAAGTDGVWRLHGRCDPDALVAAKMWKK